MNGFSSKQFFLLFAALGFLAPQLAQSQTVLLQDNFDDGFVDPLLWITSTAPAPPFFTPRFVTESGGSIFLMNRGYLATASDYDPIANGGIRITGTWKALLPGDELTVVTRSNALPSGNNLNVGQGIACHVRVGFPGSSVAIERMEGGTPLPLAGASVAVSPGETFAFEIIDDGISVTFSITKLGAETPAVSLFTPIDVDNPTDRVVFHNSANNFYLAFLDNVSIESLLVEEVPPTPEEIIVDTLDVVIDLKLPKGTANSLISKLDNALVDLALGDLEGAADKLKAFINQTKAQSGKKIPSSDADELIEAAENIRALVLEELAI